MGIDLWGDVHRTDHDIRIDLWGDVHGMDSSIGIDLRGDANRTDHDIENDLWALSIGRAATSESSRTSTGTCTTLTY